MLKWIFFDITGTLLDERPFMAAAMDMVYDALLGLGREISRADFDAAADDLRASKARSTLRGLMGRFTDTRDEFEAVLDAYLSDMAAKIRRLMPTGEGVAETVEKLAGKYSLGVIANQIPEARDALDECGILDYFGVIVLSGEEAFAKPDPRMFTTALARAGCRPEEAMMVGDRWETDVRPALEAGMRGVLYSPPDSFYEPTEPAGGLRPERTIGSLPELLDIV